MPIFEIKNLTYKYDKLDNNAKNAISDISFNVDRGDVIALIGKSGSGKSTLISHLNGLLKADSGTILFDGQDIYDKSYDLTKLRFKCGLVFQYPDYQLFADTVIDDVSFGVIKKGLSKEEAYKKSLEVLESLHIEHLKDEIPFNLSGGEKRKVAFAGVFVMEPDVLILDEPDAGLDSVTKRHMYDYLKKINKEKNITIIFITHNLDDVVEYADKVIILNDGRLAYFGKAYDALSDVKLLDSCGLAMPHAMYVAKEFDKHNITYDKYNLKYENILSIFRQNLRND